MTVRFGTLFDRRYASRGIAMLESLEVFRRPGDEVFVLCIDDDIKSAMESVSRGRWRILAIRDLGDAAILEVKKTRPHREFCWTCAPVLSAYLTRISADGDIAIYVDADLLFFGDPCDLLRELDNGGSILIHEHRYSPDRMAWLETAGRFNVAFVAFQIGTEARACVARWRAQTIESCESDSSKGLLGDQGYLNEWPGLYPNLRIMRNIGGGVAPWNVNQYAVSGGKTTPMVDDTAVVFYHYHSLKAIFAKPFGLIAVWPAVGYEFTEATHNIFYRPYLTQLRRAIGIATKSGLPVEGDKVESLPTLLREFLDSQIVLIVEPPKEVLRILGRAVKCSGRVVAGLRRRIMAIAER